MAQGMDQESRVFVIQEHHARTLHHDFRLERDGVLKSWAVPKGLPLEKGVKHLALETEDHPLRYADFEGLIEEGQYGAGTVKIWDRGTYKIREWTRDRIVVELAGERAAGGYALIRFKKGGDRAWLVLRS